MDEDLVEVNPRFYEKPPPVPVRTIEPHAIGMLSKLYENWVIILLVIMIIAFAGVILYLLYKEQPKAEIKPQFRPPPPPIDNVKPEAPPTSAEVLAVPVDTTPTKALSRNELILMRDKSRKIDEIRASKITNIKTEDEITQLMEEEPEVVPTTSSVITEEISEL